MTNIINWILYKILGPVVPDAEKYARSNAILDEILEMDLNDPRLGGYLWLYDMTYYEEAGIIDPSCPPLFEIDHPWIVGSILTALIVILIAARLAGW